jgi:hypothetical protein
MQSGDAPVGEAQVIGKPAPRFIDADAKLVFGLCGRPTTEPSVLPA